MDAVFEHARSFGRPLPNDPAITSDPHVTLDYARNVIRRPFSAGEVAIATNAYCAYWYANQVLKGPFFAGEKIIATDAYCAYSYAHDVLGGPFPAGEKAIATEAAYAYWYALLLDGPFSAGEPIFVTSLDYAYCYARDILKDLLPESLHFRALAEVPEYAEFARKIINDKIGRLIGQEVML